MSDGNEEVGVMQFGRLWGGKKAAVGAGGRIPSKRRSSSKEAKGGVEPLSEAVFSVQYNADDQTIAACYADAEIRLFRPDGNNFKAINYIKRKVADTEDSLAAITSEDIRIPLTALRWQANSPKTLVTVSPKTPNGVVQFWDSTNGTITDEIVEEGNKIECMDFMRKGTSFATGGTDCKVRVYDAMKVCRTLAFRDELSEHGHSSKISAIRFHPTDANIVVSCGWEKLINVWDLRQEHPAKIATGPMVCSEAIDISQHGLELLTGSTNPRDSIQLWDLGNPKSNELQVKSRILYDNDNPAHNEMWQVQSCRLSGLGNLIVAGGAGLYNLRIYDRHSGKALGEYQHDSAITCIDINTKHDAVVFGDQKGEVCCIDVATVMADDNLKKHVSNPTNAARTGSKGE